MMDGPRGISSRSADQAVAAAGGIIAARSSIQELSGRCPGTYHKLTWTGNQWTRQASLHYAKCGVAFLALAWMI
jgi:hypothetical protein